MGVSPWEAPALKGMDARRTWLHGARPVVCVDASGCGIFALVLFVDGEDLTFSPHMPAWVAAGKCDIYDAK